MSSVHDRLLKQLERGSDKTAEFYNEEPKNLANTVGRQHINVIMFLFILWIKSQDDLLENLKELITQEFKKLRCIFSEYSVDCNVRQINFHLYQKKLMMI